MLKEKLVLVIKQDWIKKNSIDEALELISFLTTEQTFIKRFAGKLELSFREWEEENREEWNTSAIAQWLYQLSRSFPYWFVFLNPMSPANILAMKMLAALQAINSQHKYIDFLSFAHCKDFILILGEKQRALYKKWFNIIHPLLWERALKVA